MPSILYLLLLSPLESYIYQHHPRGNPELVAQDAMFFTPPPDDGSTESFDAFIYQTQAVQALCIGTQAQV
jgi:hypothetical protein